MKRGPRVLAIDDEPAMTSWIKTVLEQHGYEVTTAEVGALGQERLKTWRPAAIVTDLVLPDVDGVEHIRKLKELDPDVAVIVLSGQGDVPRSVEAVKAGAFDFLEKPVDPDLLLDRLAKAISETRLVDENTRLKKRLDERAFQHIVGASDRMRALFEMIACVAPSEANILIRGENGTGKELIANAIHENSLRSKGRFVKVNCAAIPQELIESELFGYKKGAFTGANADKPGLFELASGGSLLLDEIGEMPSYLQTKLLRALQEREYRPVGSDRTVAVDVRLICATNVNVETALREGTLREDLYFRINTITLMVPPLRERTEDIPLLCEHFSEKFRRQYQKGVMGLSVPVHQLFMRYRWPGNVRELENVIERAVIVAKGREVEIADLPEPLRNSVADTADFVVPPNRTLAEIEKMAIVQTLERTKGNKMEAAEMLGVYRPTLYSKIKKYHLQKDTPASS